MQKIKLKLKIYNFKINIIIYGPGFYATFLLNSEYPLNFPFKNTKAWETERVCERERHILRNSQHHSPLSLSHCYSNPLLSSPLPRFLITLNHVSFIFSTVFSLPFILSLYACFTSSGLFLFTWVTFIMINMLRNRRVMID